VTPALLDELEALVPLAPLHEPHNLAPIRMAMRLNPDLPQIACFDTAFHRTMPELNQAFALPHALYDEGIRRYGFHGLSYEYIASVLPTVAPDIAGGRVVVAHLGNGSSACALREGKSVATTMGFTALDGLPMGTRCGALDPGIVLHLLQQKGLSADAVNDLLYRKSGMLGVSGVSSDFRELLASPDPRARFAIELFCHSTARHIASLAAALGGLDGIVFTAGVGENAAPVRARICRACAWLGVELDDAANERHGPRITAEHSTVAAYVVKTDENVMIARHARSLL
jgi:acetate kinase